MASLCRGGVRLIRHTERGGGSAEPTTNIRCDGWEEGHGRHEEPSARRADANFAGGYDDGFADARAGCPRSSENSSFAAQTSLQTGQDLAYSVRLGGYTLPLHDLGCGKPESDGRGGGCNDRGVGDDFKRNAPGRTRTSAARISDPTLYPLSYRGRWASKPPQRRSSTGLRFRPPLWVGALLAGTVESGPDGAITAASASCWFGVAPGERRVFLQDVLPAVGPRHALSPWGHANPVRLLEA
jgi:hypothetical protein